MFQTLQPALAFATSQLKVYVRESGVSRVGQVGVAHLMHGVESDVAGLDRRHRGRAGPA